MILCIVLYIWLVLADDTSLVYLIQQPVPGSEFTTAEGRTVSQIFTGIAVGVTDVSDGVTFDFVDDDSPLPRSVLTSLRGSSIELSRRVFALDLSTTKARATLYPKGTDASIQFQRLGATRASDPSVVLLGQFNNGQRRFDVQKFVKFGEDGASIGGILNDVVAAAPEMRYPGIGRSDRLNDEYSMLSRILDKLIPNPRDTPPPTALHPVSEATLVEFAKDALKDAQSWKTARNPTPLRRVMQVITEQWQTNARQYVKNLYTFSYAAPSAALARAAPREPDAHYGRGPGTQQRIAPGGGDVEPPGFAVEEVFAMIRRERRARRPREIDSADVGPRACDRAGRRPGLVRREAVNLADCVTGFNRLEGQVVQNARVAGTEVSISSVKIASGLNAAGAVVGIALGISFIVVDIINNNWVGAALGVAGLAALGAVATAEALGAVLGPLGWLIDIAMSALFFILPTIFTEKKDPPTLDNTTAILRWKFFGDVEHSGNEKCRQGINSNGDSAQTSCPAKLRKREEDTGATNPYTGVPLNANATNSGDEPADDATTDLPADKNCEVLYSFGAIQTFFDLGNFESAVVMIKCNNGWPMSLETLAACFQIPKDGATQPDTAIKGLTIECQNSAMTSNAYTADFSDNDRCLVIKGFKFDLSDITIPLSQYNGTNVTTLELPALEAKQRIIDVSDSGENNGGDCNLFTDSSGGFFVESLNRTVAGKPVAITCGIEPLKGRIDLMTPEPYNGNSSEAHPSNSTSANGALEQGPPLPPATPFTGYDETNGICWNNYRAKVCLPNDTYPADLKFFVQDWPDSLAPDSFTAAESVTGPPGSQVLFGGRNNLAIDVPLNDKTELQNRLKSFADGGGKEISLILPDITPGACIYTGKDYTGMVTCAVVPGAGDLDPRSQTKIESFKLIGDANVQVFADKYADGQGTAYVARNYDVADISTIPIGPDDKTLEGNLRAMSIFKGVQSDPPADDTGDQGQTC